MDRGIKRLKSDSGETIGETLVAIVIAALSVIILVGAVLASGRVNDSLKNDDAAFVHGGVTGSTASSVTVKTEINGNESSGTLPVRVYATENGYYYYEINKD